MRLVSARVLLSLGVIALGVACKGRPADPQAPGSSVRKHSGPSIAVIDLRGGAPEADVPKLLGGARKRSFDVLLDAIAEIEKDKEQKGVVVRFGGATLGMARAQELGARMAVLRQKTQVYCHADGLSNAMYMVAARACSRIFLSPAGELETVGLAAQVMYFRRLLADELRLDIDILQVGKFKGAEEPLTRDGPSPEARASLEAVLRELRDAWLTDVKAGRPQALEAVEDGPFGPKKAKERGLIDAIGYADDAMSQLKAEQKAEREQVFFGAGATDGKPDDMGELLRVLAQDGEGAGPVALVRASGSIAMSGGSGVLGGRGGITEKEYSRVFEKLSKDDDVKAVVLRIDSPGGSALASDLMWQKLMKIRAKKPLVVSVGDMAASGGYYLASTANVIYAEPTSIVGSIGVVGGKIGIGSALGRVGIHVETFAASPKPGSANRAAYMSFVTPWDEPTKQRVFESMSSIYDLFLERVAEGRKTTPDKIAPHAEGRIFGGVESKRRGLVDEIGGLGDAIRRARELAKLPESAAVVAVRRKPKFLEDLEGGGDEAQERAAAGAVRSATGASSLMDVLEEQAPDVAPFVSSLAPLMSGERTLACVPFVLRVH